MGQQDVRQAAALAAFDVVDAVVVVVEVDPAATHPVLEANAALSRLAGCGRDQVVGRPLAELQPPEVVDAFARRVDEVVATGRPMRYQADREGPAGRITHQVTLCPLAGPVNSPPRVVVVLQDVSALRRVTEALVTVEQAANIGTWTWEIAEDKVRWSAQLYRVFGLHRTAFEPSFAGYLDHVHPEDRPRVRTIVDGVFSTGEPTEFEHRIVTPEGEVRWLHCTAGRFDDAEGTPQRMHGTARLLTTPPHPGQD